VIPGARLIILGRQGAGKGTQCVRLSRHYVVPHISTGDMLRTAAREGSELGLMAKQIMEEGGLVGDEVMIGLVDERLRKPDADSRGYILDGFPRTVAQAQALQRITDDRPIHVVIDLDVPREIVLERLSSRRVCRDCGTNYTAGLADDRRMWICDVCGGDVEHRADDTPDAVNRRLDLYESQTAPLISHYSKMNLLAVVNGVGHPDHVFKRVCDAVDERR
jgi:adenylate kinase